MLWYLWAADFPPLSVQDLCSIFAVFVQALCSICEAQNLWAADFPPLSVQDLCSISALFVQALCSICEVQYLWAADFAGREGQIYN